MEEIRLQQQQSPLTTLITLTTCRVTSRFRLDISKTVKTLNYRSSCQASITCQGRISALNSFSERKTLLNFFNLMR